MPRNDADRSVSHTSFGHNARIFQGDLNVSSHSSRKTLDLDYLHEATFNAANKQHTSTCLENTRAQVLRQTRTWADGDGEKRIYWLRGMAGTGKTTISMTIAREYYRRNRLGASFFFSRGSGDLASTRKFVATIANQFAESSPIYREHLSAALETYPSISSRGLYDQWEKLILEPLRLMKLEGILHPILIVIDALDECDSQYDMGVVIQCLADVTTLENIPFRVFITSRPERPIHLGFDSILSISRQDFALHDIEESIVGKDLEIYYKHELLSMEIDTALITEDNIEKLVEKSRGLFIHAATVCRFIRQGEIFAAARLSSFISSEDLQLESERELDSVYTTVLENAFVTLTSLRSDEMKTLQLFFHKVVGSVVMLFDRMSPTDFAIMVGEPEGNIIRLLKHLGSVLDVAEQSSGQISVLHPSFRDFLTDPRRNSGAYFSISPRKIHGHLFQRCLEVMAKHLRKNMCRIRQPGTRTKDISKLEVDNHISYVLQYACNYWIYHLQQSDVNPREHPGILEFFQSRLLFWLEALALIGRLSDGLSMIRILDSLLSRRRMPTSIKEVLAKIKPSMGSDSTRITSQSLSAVVHDAVRFLSTHSAAIEDAPLQLYCSALIFSPRTSLIRRIYRHLIPSWILCIPSVFESWDPRLRRLHHLESARTVVFSPDGTLIASGYSRGSVCLWDASTGARRRILKGHTSEAVSITFSHDSKLIASASEDMAIRIWNAITGVELRTYQRTHRIRSVRFLPDNKRIIFNQPLGAIWSWDLVKNEELWVSHPPDDHSYHRGYGEITVSADGKLVICGDSAKTEQIWLLDTETGKSLYDAKVFERRVDCIACSPDSKLLAVGLYRRVELWNIATGATWRIATKHSPDDIVFSPDGKSIAAFNTIDIWNVVSGKKWCEIQDPHMRLFGGPERFAFSPDGAIVASAGRSEGIALWDTRFSKKQSAPLFDWHHSSVFAASPDDKQFASGSYGDALRLWDGQTGARNELYAHKFRPFIDIISDTFQFKKLISHFRKPSLLLILPSHFSNKINIVSIIFSPNSEFLACVWKTKKLQLWDTQTGKLLFSRKLASSTSDNVVFSPDGTLVASLSNKIHFWDTSTGAELYASESPLGQVEAVAFSPNGRFFVSSISTDFMAEESSVCDSGDFYGYTHISVYVIVESYVQFSSDSKLLAYQFNDKVLLLDVETRVFLHAFSPYDCLYIGRLAFSCNNRFLVALYTRDNVCIWEVATGAVIHEVDLEENDQGLCFSLNGRHIASLDKVLAYRSSAISNCHSPGISHAEGWIKDDGQDIIYFPPDCRRIFDFMAGSSLVFAWPRVGFLREVVQHLGCNVLQLAMVDKIMDGSNLQD